MINPVHIKLENVQFSKHHSDSPGVVKSLSFGGRLRQERARIGLTQTAMAEIGGVKRTTQHIYETDIRVPDLHYLTRVRDAGADLAFLILGERQPGGRTDMLAISYLTLSNIYRVVDEFCIDTKGKPLPLENRVRFFQLLCVSMKSRDSDDADLDVLREELSRFAGK